MAGAVVSIDVIPPLVVGGISAGVGVTISDLTIDVGTVDFKATFAARTEILSNLATIQINTPTPVTPVEPNVVFVNTVNRETVGISPEGVEMPARRFGTFVTVNPPPVAPPAPGPPPP